MKRLVYIAAAGALMVFGAAAQDAENFAKLNAEAKSAVVTMRTMGMVTGPTVKGAPYSGEEVNEISQALADGTRIHRETRTTVYRDSEGRTRRDTPDSITISDPVANITYLLFPKTMTGQKLTKAAGIGAAFLARPTGPGQSFTMTTSGDGPTHITVNGEPLDDKAVAEAMAKAKASGASQTVTFERRETVTSIVNGALVSNGVQPGSAVVSVVKNVAGESLGEQTIEGVSAHGARFVSTIDAGAIGNDRPIQTVNESWYSKDLKVNIMTKRSDPRTGDETFRLTNISRNEPAANLFQAPAGYQITERK